MPCIHGLDYIREKRPRLVVLEQVKGMLTRFKQIFDAIFWHLEHFGYHVRWRVLNTLDVGALPQNRERLYLVAIRQDSFLHKFKWPKPLPTRPLSDILDASIRGGWHKGSLRGRTTKGFDMRCSGQAEKVLTYRRSCSLWMHQLGLQSTTGARTACHALPEQGRSQRDSTL